MTRNKRLFLAAKILIVLVVVWGIHREATRALSDIQQQRWDLDYFWLSLSAVFYVLSMLPSARFWQRVMRTMGQEAYYSETLRAYIIGHLGKYVPGKALVVVLRAGLMRSHRVETAVAAVSVFFETLSMMAVGSLLAAVVLAVMYPEHWQYALLAVLFMGVVGLPTLPPVFKRLIQLIAVGKRYPDTAEKIARVRFSTLLGGWAGLTLAWVLMGLGLWATLRGMSGGDYASLGDLPLYTACVSLAVVGGFISQVPGGFGVREFILVKMLAPVVGDSLAVGSTIMLRLVSIVAELGISAILYWATGTKPAPRPDEAVTESQSVGV